MSARPEKVRMAIAGDDRSDPHAGDDLLTARNVADMFGVTPGTVLDWWQAGKLPGFRLGGTRGGHLRFWRSEILRVLETWRDGAPPAPADSQLRVVE